MRYIVILRLTYPGFGHFYLSVATSNSLIKAMNKFLLQTLINGGIEV